MIGKAKKLFFKYNGSHSQMENDGVLEEYRKHHVSREQEKQWMEEIEIQQIEALNSSTDVKKDFVFLCLTVERTKNLEQFQALYEFLLSEKTERCDTIGRVYMVSTFVDLMRSLRSYIDVAKYRPSVQNLLKKLQLSSADPEVQRRVPLISDRLNRL